MCFFLIFRSLGCQNTGSHPAGKAQKKRNVPKIIVKKNFISKMCKNGYLVGLNNDFGQPGKASLLIENTNQGRFSAKLQ